MQISSPKTVAASFVVALALCLTFALAPASGAGARKPRLSTGLVQVSSRSVEAGKTLTVIGVVRNRGRRAFKRGGALTVKLRRGRLRTLRIGSAPVPRVRAGRVRTFRIKATIPASAAPAGAATSSGPFGVVVCVKAQGNTGSRRCGRARRGVTVTASPSSPTPTPTASPAPTASPEPPPATTFTPGSRSLGDPLFPQIGNGGYDALHYRIELRYDPSTNSFGAGTTTQITAKATQDLSQLSLDFQDDLPVSGVSVDGLAASFEQVDATPAFSANPDVSQPQKLVVTPAAGIASGSQFLVRVSYSGTPVQIEDADESFEGWVRSCRTIEFGLPCDGAYTVNEPIGAQSWYPSNNVPSDKATFETITTVPTTHVALGTGELSSRMVNGDGTWTWDWVEDDQTAPFLATATVGLFDYSNNTSLTENVSGRNIPIYKAIDSSKNATAKNTFNTNTAAIPNVMNYLADSYGPYPFDSTGAVSDIAPDVGYALENQTKPHYASSFTSSGVGFSASTQVHELSHQWFGDAISPATWQQIWFSEGWATFTENAYDPGPPAGEDTQNLEDFFADVYSTPDDQTNPEDEWKRPRPTSAARRTCSTASRCTTVPGR